jgi:poly(3-hydroxybutyrate) depolymerase
MSAEASGRRGPRLGAVLFAALLLAAAPALVRAEPPATGDLKRDYDFTAGGRRMLYRLYVPSSYDGRAAYPLVVVLHGAGGDENRVFETSDIAALAEKNRVIVLSPLGYGPFGGYGDIYPVVVTREAAARSADLAALAQAPLTAVPPRQASETLPPAAKDDYYELPAAALAPPKASQLSEQDVMNVLDLVRRAYRIDPARIYLMGNSMGGVGTLYLAAKYPETWAAIAPAGGVIAAWSYPYGRLQRGRVAVLFVHGEKDEHANPFWTRRMAEEAKLAGVETSLNIVPGGSHSRAWIEAMPQTFRFLLQHHR